MVTSYNTSPSGSKSGGSTALVAVVALALAAAGYYFLVYKPEEDRKRSK